MLFSNTFNTSLSVFQVNDATMTDCDILNTNGVIHVINKVLLPDQHTEGWCGWNTNWRPWSLQGYLTEQPSTRFAGYMTYIIVQQAVSYVIEFCISNNLQIYNEI